MVVKRQMEKQNVDVDALIDQGAKVKEDFGSEAKEWHIVNLRISKKMLKEVDQAVDERVGITRTGWILEAIHEKLKDKNVG